MLTDGAQPARGCGKRKKGGIYAVMKLSEKGRPLEDFLIDPPHLLPFAVPALGMKAFNDENGTTHLADWIGADSYPNPWDFIEEVRRFGLSRRVPASAPLNFLTPKSRIMCVHRGAFIHNRGQDELKHDLWGCPTGKHKAGERDEMCIGLPLWMMACREGIDEIMQMPLIPHGVNTIRRVMPSFAYTGFSSPEGYEQVCSPAIFASLPISCFEIVAGGTDKEMTRAHKAVESAWLPVVEVSS